jgi:hypothetical protein
MITTSLALLASTGLVTFLSYVSVWIVNLVYLFEALVYVDLVYALDRTFDEKAKENNKIYIVKATFTIIAFLAAGCLCFFSFQYNPVWISWTNIGVFAVFLIIALLRIFPENSLMVANMVALCLTVLSFYVLDH